MEDESRKFSNFEIMKSLFVRRGIFLFLRMEKIYILYFVFISALSFFIFGADKFQAKNLGKRISESTLLIATFLGGTFGSLFGMFVFSHKISKKTFILKFLIVILIQFLILYLIFKNYLHKI